MRKCIHGKPIKECIFCWKADQFDVCPTCGQKYTDLENRASIQEGIECLKCDSMRSDR